MLRTSVGAQSRRAAQSRRIGENRRTAQSRRAGPMSPCHVIAKLSHRKRIVVHILNKLTIIKVKAFTAYLLYCSVLSFSSSLQHLSIDV